MKTLVVGDLHGKLDHVVGIDRWAKENDVDLVIQTGDFGINWPGEPCRISHYFEKNKDDGPIWISCLGNHDNYNRWQEKALPYLSDTITQQDIGNEKIPFTFINRDAVYVRKHNRLFLMGRGVFIRLDDNFLTSIGFCGGAVSSDAIKRQENKDWWRNEAPTRAELEIFCDQLINFNPDWVVSHDRPAQDSFTGEFREGMNPISGLPCNYVGQSFWRMMSGAYGEINPSLTHWFYGHIHEIRKTPSQYIKGATLYGTGYHGTGWLFDDANSYSSELDVVFNYRPNKLAGQKHLDPYKVVIPQGVWD